MKGRDPGKPIPCIVGDRAQVAQLCASWPPVAEKLANRFWPGPLTLVLPARPQLPGPLHPAGLVGLRLSSHPWARALALRLGSPITSTSANPSGGREVVSVGELDAGLRGKLGYVLDGGPTPGGLASTVVRLDDRGLTCLRRGAIALEDVEAAARS